MPVSEVLIPMSKNHVCGVCGKDKSPFVMNNKQVCLACDELLFDMEIECEEMNAQGAHEGTKATTVPAVTDKKA